MLWWERGHHFLKHAITLLLIYLSVIVSVKNLLIVRVTGCYKLAYILILYNTMCKISNLDVVWSALVVVMGVKRFILH